MNGKTYTKQNEGFTPKAKPDNKGAWVIGYGHDIPAPAWGQPIPEWTPEQADAQYEIDYAAAVAAAAADVSNFVDIDPVRQAVLVDMAFELGGTGLAGFQHMLAAVALEDWPTAALELKDSKLFTQVPNREQRNISILLSGSFDDMVTTGKSMDDTKPKVNVSHVVAAGGVSLTITDALAKAYEWGLNWPLHAPDTGTCAALAILTLAAGGALGLWRANS